jgi:hypothetical protein
MTGGLRCMLQRIETFLESDSGESSESLKETQSQKLARCIREHVSRLVRSTYGENNATYGHMGNAIALAVRIGNEYRDDYNDLKDVLGSVFVQTFRRDMVIVHQLWEEFYVKFMRGVEGSEMGEIKQVVSSFVNDCVSVMVNSIGSEPISLKETGKNKNGEYEKLLSICQTQFKISAPDFEARISFYVKRALRMHVMSCCDPFLEGLHK